MKNEIIFFGGKIFYLLRITFFHVMDFFDFLLSLTFKPVPKKLEYRFLSDSDDCYKCLESKIESGYFGGLFDLHRVDHSTEVESIVSRLDSVIDNVTQKRRARIRREMLRRALGVRTLPTRFDRPDLFVILHGLIENIKKAAIKNKMDISKFPRYAILPTGKVNALAVKLDCCDLPFLLFDSQLFLFCHLFAKSFLGVIPVQSEGGGILRFDFKKENIFDNLKSNPDRIARLVDLLFCYVEQGDPSSAQPYFPDDEYFGIVEIVREGMELFVVGHEFGHVYNKHLDTEMLQIIKDHSVEKNLSKNHIKEYEADLLGVSLMVNCLFKRGMDPGMSLLGAYLFFVALEYSERISHFLMFETFEGYLDKGSETHPSFNERKAFVKIIGKHIFNGEYAKESLSILDDIDSPVEIIWHVLKKFCENELKAKSK